MFEKIIALLITAGMIATPYLAETEVIPVVELAREVKAYVGPVPDSESDQYWQQVADSIRFRFDVDLAADCYIEEFVLSPSNFGDRTLESWIHISSQSIDNILVGELYDPEEREYHFNALSPGFIRDLELKEDELDYYYSWFDHAGGIPRSHFVIVLKECKGIHRTYFWAELHTYLDSIDDLQQWVE